jgi:hypothetical protein
MGAAAAWGPSKLHRGQPWGRRRDQPPSVPGARRERLDCIFLIFFNISKMLQHFANCWQKKLTVMKNVGRSLKMRKMLSNILKNVATFYKMLTKNS